MANETDRARGEIERRGYRVVGHVQGVGFRWWTQRTADELGIAGKVRNRTDGSVEVQAAGAAEALDRFETALRGGPSSARVDRLEPIDADGSTPLDEFRVVL